MNEVTEVFTISASMLNPLTVLIEVSAMNVIQVLVPWRNCVYSVLWMAMVGLAWVGCSGLWGGGSRY